MQEQTQPNKDENSSGEPPEETTQDSPKEASDSLENTSTVDATKTQLDGDSQTTEQVTDTTHGAKIQKKNPMLRGFSKLAKVNLYLLLFFLILLLAGIIAFVGYQKSKNQQETTSNTLTEPLSQETLDQLRQSDVRVGDAKQILSVESNAIFSGKVLVRDSLEVAGQLKIGGSLSLSGLNVSGASNFDQVNVNNLDVSGNTNIKGQLAVQQGITVGGNLSVAGGLSASKLTIDNLLLNGDLQLNRHIDAGGGTPNRSNGSALGSGGTASNNGTDTAGTVNINTGGGSGAGCYVTLRFNQSFGSTPHVVITPVGSAAGKLDYYINRSSSQFSICSANSAGSGQSFAFDYIVID